jgi:hypothetical protein
VLNRVHIKRGYGMLCVRIALRKGGGGGKAWQNGPKSGSPNPLPIRGRGLNVQ